MMRVLSVWLWMLFAGVAMAATPAEEAQNAELDRIRREVAGQIQLSAYDLVDEIVYDWTVDPPFDKKTRVVVAGVSVPVGLGTGMQALVENHLNSVILENPSTNVELVHCPQCTQVVVQSGPEATVVSRGIDNPQVFEDLGVDADLHALFVDIEAEGAFLVIRARLTRLEPDLPIVWSRSASSSTARPALLRDPTDLKSAEDAREEYLAALRDRGPLSALLRLGIRYYAPPFDAAQTPTPPILWVGGGVEYAPTPARAWTGSFVIAGSHIPSAYTGIMAESRLNRLLTGRSRSHIRPDLYLFVGGSVHALWGASVAPFATDPVTALDVLRANDGEAPNFLFGAFNVGLDLRLGNRIGFNVFLETAPMLQRSPNVDRHLGVIGVDFQALGAEVQLCF